MAVKKKATKKKGSTINKKKVLNPKVPRTRNASTMTESMFWSMIRSSLRQTSRWWKPIAAAKQAAKRPYKGPNKLQKFEYQCAKCQDWFKDKEVAVDHIVECGELRSSADLAGFVERLFCEEGFQVLCRACHLSKTLNERFENKKQK